MTPTPNPNIHVTSNPEAWSAMLHVLISLRSFHLLASVAIIIGVWVAAPHTYPIIKSKATGISTDQTAWVLCACVERKITHNANTPRYIWDKGPTRDIIYATAKCHHLQHKQWGPSFFHESRSCTPVIVSSFHGKEKKRKKKSDEHSTRAYACSKVRSSIVCPFCFLILGKEKDARC